MWPYLIKEKGFLLVSLNPEYYWAVLKGESHVQRLASLRNHVTASRGLQDTICEVQERAPVHSHLQKGTMIVLRKNQIRYFGRCQDNNRQQKTSLPFQPNISGPDLEIAGAAISEDSEETQRWLIKMLDDRSSADSRF